MVFGIITSFFDCKSRKGLRSMQRQLWFVLFILSFYWNRKNYLHKKAERANEPFFGSSAIFDRKILCFPSPPHGGFGFVGFIYLIKDFIYPLFGIIVAPVAVYVKACIGKPLYRTWSTPLSILSSSSVIYFIEYSRIFCAQVTLYVLSCLS
jgi:hypothetical protein